MTHIKKLFLTLSLLAMQSAFGMDPVTKKARTGEWTLVTTEQDFDQRVGTFIVVDRHEVYRSENAIEDQKPYYLRPFQPIAPDAEHPIYELIDCIGGNDDDAGGDDLLSNEVHSANHPWKVRGLTRAEVHTVKLGSEVGYYDDQDKPVVPNEIRLNSLKPSEQTKWIVEDHLKFPLTLMGIHRFRYSALDPLPKDVARFICKLAMADVRRENPVLKSVD